MKPSNCLQSHKSVGVLAAFLANFLTHGRSDFTRRYSSEFFEIIRRIEDAHASVEALVFAGPLALDVGDVDALV